MLRILRNTSGFTLIELIVGMLIFSIGMTAILALLQSTINNSLYSRHEVVASNLLREQVELVKNVRNTNVRNFVPFDSAKFE
jgi:prepilin-type N-terminal cleavage/methylation domain-containing protein